MKSQEQLWNDIAQEWNEYKKIPSKFTIEFLENSNGKVLDLGSGTTRHLMSISNGKMYLLDFSERMINLAKKKAEKENINAEFVVSNMTKIPFENDFFDFGICISALHCLPKKEHEKVVKELYRVLKSGGKFLIAVWNKDSKRFKKYKEKEKYIGWKDKGKRYYYLFEEDEIHDLFKKNGFKIIKTQNSDLMIRFIVEKFSL